MKCRHVRDCGALHPSMRKAYTVPTVLVNGRIAGFLGLLLRPKESAAFSAKARQPCLSQDERPESLESAKRRAQSSFDAWQRLRKITKRFPSPLIATSTLGYIIKIGRTTFPTRMKRHFRWTHKTFPSGVALCTA